VIFDHRDDVAERTSEARVVLDIDTEDAASVVERTRRWVSREPLLFQG
jgi:hypothetical protein